MTQWGDAVRKACADVGIRSEQIDLPAYVTEHELLATIRRLNRDPEIHGIVLQLPLPGHLHELELQRQMAPEKEFIPSDPEAQCAFRVGLTDRDRGRDRPCASSPRGLPRAPRRGW